jgi:hypothetical protein
MLERSDRLLRMLCVVLAILLVAQWARVIFRRSPLAGVVIPSVPTLVAATNAAPDAGQATSLARVSKKQETNAFPSSGAMAAENGAKGTNTNALARAVSSTTNGAGSVPGGEHTNVVAKTNIATVPAPGSGPHGPGRGMPSTGARGSPGSSPGLAGPPGQGVSPALPPEVQSRIDRITDSEILAPANKPLPMALLGIAGRDVFLRTATGQTGLVKQGEDLGGVKILKVGINRVLVEEQGEKKELTISQGLGGESLMPKQPDNPK